MQHAYDRAASRRNRQSPASHADERLSQGTASADDAPFDHRMSPLHKGDVTAAAQRSQRRIPSRVTHPHAMSCIHHGSFVGFSVPSASQRCVFAAQSRMLSSPFQPFCCCPWVCLPGPMRAGCGSASAAAVCPARGTSTACRSSYAQSPLSLAFSDCTAERWNRFCSH
jgi:hypothetical protein